MPGTKVNTIRRTTFVDGAYVYKITATCIDRGTLPDLNIFLLQITDEGDPKDDPFVRVCELGDFTVYSAARARALAALQTYWRTDTVNFQFEDVETANAAWQELSARINTLVEADDLYDDQFATAEAGAVITYPTVALGIVDTLKEAYEVKKAAVVAAQSAYDIRAASCGGHEAKLTTNAQAYAQAEADLKAMLAVQATLNAGHAIYQSVQASLWASCQYIRSLNAASDATDVQQDGIDGQLDLQQALLNQMAAQNAATATALSGGLAACVARLQATITSLTQDKTGILQQLNQCTAETTRLNAQLTVAKEQRDQALQAVIVVCPDFTG